MVSPKTGISHFHAYLALSNSHVPSRIKTQLQKWPRDLCFAWANAFGIEAFELLMPEKRNG
jgi:hypothetical protein